MSKKYIAQNNVSNFVYPNNKLAEYDVEIIHELKENSVSGITSGFSILYDIGTGNINLSFTYQWYLNNAEPFINYNGKLNILSVHLMTNEKQYYKPWNCIGLIQRDDTSLTYVTDTQNFTITPAMMGQTSFLTGKYYAEIRMIGHRAIYPINYNINVNALTPNPTPTPTPTQTPTSTPGFIPSTPTPTPTPSSTPSGGGGSYNYYSITKYNCPGCTINTTGLFGRTTNPTTLTNGHYYNNGDGFVYLVNFGTAGPSYDVDLDGSASSGTSCPGTCAI